MHFKWTVRPIVIRRLGIVGIVGMVIRHQGVSQSTDGIRVLGLEHRDDGIERRLLGDLEFPRAWTPRRCHIVLVQHRHAYLPQEKKVWRLEMACRGHRSFQSDQIWPNWVINDSTVSTVLSDGEECSGNITLGKSCVLDQNDLGRSRKIDYLSHRKNSRSLV